MEHKRLTETQEELISLIHSQTELRQGENLKAYVAGLYQGLLILEIFSTDALKHPLISELKEKVDEIEFG